MIDKFPLRMDNQARTPHNEIAECPACGFSAGYFVTVEEYHVFRCTTCGHGFFHPGPSDDLLKTEYSLTQSKMSNNNGYELLRAYLKNPAAIRDYFKWMVRQCRNILEDCPTDNPRILDIGCSTGVLLRCLADAGYSNVHGIEINENAATMAREQLGLDVMNCRVEDLPRADAYDLIIATFVLSNLRDPTELFETLGNHLNPRGSVFFIVPNFDGILRSIMGAQWLWYDVPFHIHHFTVPSLRHMIAGTDLEIKDLYTTNTGTYLFLLYCLLFGFEKTQSAAGRGFTSVRTVMMLDRLVRTALSPITYPCRLLDKEAHIVGVVSKKD